MPQIFSDPAALHAAITADRKAGLRVGFVPTMGALHAGHLSLVEAAKAQCDKVLVSIFVNPLQFGPSEDFSRYPRTLEDDIALLKSVNTDYLYTPTPDIMYPQGFTTTVQVRGVSEGLCGAARPGHFDGVATVVAKLFHQAGASDAFFGEKDYQQLQVIQRMVHDLSLSIAIHPIPTLREADGLAMSSRNRYLSDTERAIAPKLYARLCEVAQAIKAGGAVDELLEQSIAALKHDGFSAIDYLELRDAQLLSPLMHYQPPARLLVAAKLGNTRLIDNIEV